RQVQEVDKVKRSANGIIRDPLTLPPDATMARARELMATQNVSGVPITDAERRVVGILTKRDCRFQTSDDTPVGEVMTSRDLVTAPPTTSLDDARDLLYRHKIEKLIITDEKGRLAGLITMKDLDNLEAF